MPILRAQDADIAYITAAFGASEVARGGRRRNFEMLHCLAKNRILSHNPPTGWTATGLAARSRGEAFETISTRNETAPYFFIWIRDNPLKSPDSDE
jgi:hypothetical protein